MFERVEIKSATARWHPNNDIQFSFEFLWIKQTQWQQLYSIIVFSPQQTYGFKLILLSYFLDSKIENICDYSELWQTIRLILVVYYKRFN